jgi:hypothetical protein
MRDPLCLAIAAVLQTVFWFNPAMRWMAKQMEWALELRATSTSSPAARNSSASNTPPPCCVNGARLAPAGVAAFNGAAISRRIRHMQRNGCRRSVPPAPA